MTVVREQTAPLNTRSGSGNVTSTFATNPPAGSKVLVGVFAFSTSAVTVTDNGGNTYTLDRTGSGNTAVGGLVVRIFRADNIALPGAGTLVVTAALPASGSALAAAYSGVASGAPSAHNQNLQNTNSTSGNSGAAGGAGTGLHFAVVTTDLGNNPANIATTAPFNQLGAEQNGSKLTGAVSDQLDAGASQTCNWTWPVATVSTGAIVAYDAPVSQVVTPAAASATGQADSTTVAEVVTPAAALATGQANDVTVTEAVTPAAASATGQANDAGVAAVVTPTIAAATGQASAATVAAGVAPTAVSAAGQANNASVSGVATSTAASATGQANNVGVSNVVTPATATTAASSGLIGPGEGTFPGPETYPERIHGVNVEQGAWGTFGIGLALAPSLYIPTATVLPGPATAWCTANGGTADTQDGDPAPTSTALPGSAQGTGRAYPVRPAVTVRPTVANAEGHAVSVGTQPPAATFRAYAGTPVVRTTWGAGTVLLARPVHAGTPVSV